jgi:hypothetical protein
VELSLTGANFECRAALEYQRQQPELSQWQKFRKSVFMWYQSDPFQIVVALCIFFNFISQAAEAQIQPKEGSKAAKVICPEIHRVCAMWVVTSVYKVLTLGDSGVHFNRTRILDHFLH